MARVGLYAFSLVGAPAIGWFLALHFLDDDVPAKERTYDPGVLDYALFFVVIPGFLALVAAWLLDGTARRAVQSVSIALGAMLATWVYFLFALSQNPP